MPAGFPPSPLQCMEMKIKLINLSCTSNLCFAEEDNDSIYLKFLLEYNFLNYFHGE